MKLRALIVDDEPLARAYLKRLVEDCDVEVVAEAASADRLAELALDSSVDVVFLDIRMPGPSGLDAARRLADLEPAPFVVLVTGFPDHAIEAFEHAAMDYLLKPVEPERLQQTIARLRKLVSMRRRAIRSGSTRDRVGSPTLNRLAIRHRQSIRMIPIDKIYAITAQGNGSLIRTATDSIKSTYTLGQLEDLLPQAWFMRVHTSCIVNLLAIEEIVLHGNHLYSVKLINGEDHPVARQKYSDLQDRFTASVG